MPRRLAITAPHKVEVLEYQDPPLQDHQVRIKTELASGKHGTTGLITPVVPIEEGPEVFRLMEQEPDKVIKFAVRF